MHHSSVQAMQQIKAAKACIIENNLLASLQNLCRLFPDSMVFSTSFSLEDQLITHFIFTHDLPIRVFTIDTGRLFPETYETMERTRQRYGKVIEVYFPPQEAVERLVTEKGMFSFYESVANRKECCYVRKVLPLERALKGAQCWVNGLRAEHSASRSQLSLIEWDEQHRLIKYQPLLHWSSEQVRKLIDDYQVPYNPLHDRGYPSIGCQPCTRAVMPGEDMRAGRWWWETTSQKECGLHGK